MPQQEIATYRTPQLEYEVKILCFNQISTSQTVKIKCSANRPNKVG